MNERNLPETLVAVAAQAPGLNGAVSAGFDAASYEAVCAFFAPYGAESGGSGSHVQRLARQCAEGNAMAVWAARYLALKICGRSPHTLAARTRDLGAFIAWFGQEHASTDVRHWQVRHTRMYLRHLVGLRRAPNTVNRHLWSLKHWGRWMLEQPHPPLQPHDSPVADVQEMRIQEAPCKKFSAAEMRALFQAARRRTTEPKNARPNRDLALLAVLYYTGLRITELLALRRQQYTEDGLKDVARKGHTQTRMVYLHPKSRTLLDAYIKNEWRYDAVLAPDPQAQSALPLFLSSKSLAPLDRRRAARILEGLAEDANAHSGGRMHMHPHRLRHTFGSIYREASGSDAETAAALGHTTMKYVGRYARRTEAERREVLERAFSDTP